MDYLRNNVNSSNYDSLFRNLERQPMLVKFEGEDKPTNISLAAKFMNDLGYTRKDAEFCVNTIIPENNLTVDQVLTYIAAGKALRDSYDSSRTNTRHMFRDSSNLNVSIKFFPRLDYSNVTDAYKMFQGQNGVLYFPEMHFPSIKTYINTGNNTNDGNGITHIVSYNDASKYGDMYFENIDIASNFNKSIQQAICSNATLKNEFHIYICQKQRIYMELFHKHIYTIFQLYMHL